MRGHPTARKPGFPKTTLSKHCEKTDLAYRHLHKFSIPCDTRKNVKTHAEFDALFDEYEASPDPDNVKKLAEIMKEKPSVLVCLQSDPDPCHRSRLAKAVAPVAGLEIRNLIRS